MFNKIPDEEYFKTVALSSHNIMSFFFPQKQFVSNPKYFQQGTYLHAKVLENQEVAADIISKRCQDMRPTEADHMDRLVGYMSQNLEITDKIPQLLGKFDENIFTEVAGFSSVTNPKGRVIPVKGKFDLINTKDKYIVDVKTTSSLKSFDDSIYKYAYQIQAAFYLKLAHLITGEVYKDFLWAVVDKKNGKTQLIRCSDELIADGNYYVDLYINNPPTFMSF